MPSTTNLAPEIILQIGDFLDPRTLSSFIRTWIGFLEGRFEALNELLRNCGNELIEFEDKGTGDLVCEVVRHWGWDEYGKARARLLIEYGAKAHNGCEVCAMVRDEDEGLL